MGWNRAGAPLAPIALALALVAAGLPAGADHQAPAGEATACSPHPPIEITEHEGSQGFVLGHDPVTGEPIYRPGSGVVAGHGTADDPYLIQGWCILGTNTAGWLAPSEGLEPAEKPALAIEGTQAHVVVQAVTVTEATADGISIADAANVTIEDTRVRSAAGNGLAVEGASDVVVRDSVFRWNGGMGIAVSVSSHVLVAANEVHHNHHGIGVSASSGIDIVDNRVSENTFGATQERRWGIAVLSAHDETEVAHNRVTDSPLAIRASADGTVVRANELVDNRAAVDVLAAEDVTLRQNNIEDSEFTAVQAWNGLDARQNWWGCPEGPGSPGCDDVEEGVLVDPWLTEPNPDAGPRDDGGGLP